MSVISMLVQPNRESFHLSIRTYISTLYLLQDIIHNTFMDFFERGHR